MSGAKAMRRVLVCILIGCWIFMAAAFVGRTSHVAKDGIRYFSIIDDGMISMRYAKNFLQHRGLVWNVGDRVEGFTCPLWVLVMIGAIGLFGTHNGPLVMQILGGILYLTMLWLFYRTAARNKASNIGVLTGLLLLLCSYPLAYWALGGMEAVAICLVFTMAIAAQYSYESGCIGNPLMMHACLIAIAYCLRPDGWLGIAPFFAACWFDSVREGKYQRALYAPAMVISVVLAVLLARHSYYGEWMPNTYVLKVEGYSLALRLRNGTQFARQFLDENLLFLALIVLGAMSMRRIAYLIAMAACIVLAYQIYVGGDPWLYWRQLLPIYVAAAFVVLIIFEYLGDLSGDSRELSASSAASRMLALTVIFAPIIVFEYLRHFGVNTWISRQDLLMFYALATLVILIGLRYADRISALGRRFQLMLPITRLLVLIIICGAILVGNQRFVPELSGKPFSFTEQAALIDKAVLSTKLFGPGKVHHLVWAGTYPYYVEGTMIDSLGKCDKTIARYPIDEAVSWNGIRAMPGHAKYDFRQTILKRRPDIIVDFTAWGSQDMRGEIKDSYTLIKADGVSL